MKEIRDGEAQRDLEETAQRQERGPVKVHPHVSSHHAEPDGGEGDVGRQRASNLEPGDLLPAEDDVEAIGTFARVLRARHRRRQRGEHHVAHESLEFGLLRPWTIVLRRETVHGRAEPEIRAKTRGFARLGIERGVRVRVHAVARQTRGDARRVAERTAARTRSGVEKQRHDRVRGLAPVLERPVVAPAPASKNVRTRAGTATRSPDAARR